MDSARMFGEDGVVEGAKWLVRGIVDYGMGDTSHHFMHANGDDVGMMTAVMVRILRTCIVTNAGYSDSSISARIYLSASF